MQISLVAREESPEVKRLRKEFTISEKGEICIAIGGDGIFLRAAAKYDKPILFLRDNKIGSVGYNSDLSIDSLDIAIAKLKRGDYNVENLARKIEIKAKGKSYYAINEARLNSIVSEVGFTVDSVTKEGRSRVYPFVMSSDGIIVAGKIGSTAYSRSAGGPILLDPNLLCITFINADGPYSSPIVLDSDAKIEIKLVKYEAKLVYDSTEVGIMKPGEKITVSLSDRQLKVVRFKGMTEAFADKLERAIRSKMFKAPQGT